MVGVDSLSDANGSRQDGSPVDDLERVESRPIQTGELRERAGQALIEQTLAGVEVVGEAQDGEEALQAVAQLRPEVVFLDVQMPGADGLEVVRSMAAPLPKVVFCTGHDQYALDAFELNAVDYLLKPVERPRLARTVERLRRTPAEAWDQPVERLAAGAGRLLVRNGHPHTMLDPDHRRLPAW